MKNWKPLKEGDQVDIIAPSFSCSQSKLKRSIEFVRSWGLVPVISRDIFGKDILCANKDKIRFQHLKKALYNKESKMIWCLRGGYGLSRLLEPTKKLKKPSHYKLILGYSDISFLHYYVHRHWNWPSLHGSFVDGMAEKIPNKKSQKLLKEVLFGELEELSYPLKPLNQKATKSQKIISSVWGGNLSVFQTLVGSYSNHKNKILFFEDVGERAYRIDRMLIHLKQAHCFKGIKAIIFGTFSTSFSEKKILKKVLNRFAQEMNFPVFEGLPCGHGLQQSPLPLNQKVVLQIDRKSHLIFKL